jgi:hypothetical protein
MVRFPRDAAAYRQHSSLVVAQHVPEPITRVGGMHTSPQPTIPTFISSLRAGTRRGASYPISIRMVTDRRTGPSVDPLLRRERYFLTGGG